MRLSLSLLILLLLQSLMARGQTRFERIPVILPETPDRQADSPPTGLIRLPWTDYRPFLALSLEWDPSAQEDVEDPGLSWRFLSAEGDWSDWSPLRGDPHSGVEGIRAFTLQHYQDPGSVAVQIRPDRRGAAESRLVLHVFDPGPSDPAALPSAPPAQLRDAPCQCLAPALLGRLQWCPDGSCLPHPSPDFTVPAHLIIHHSAGTNSSSDWRAVVRSIWSHHVNSNGWSDIGYNFLVDPFGVIYEGRGDGVVGAHFCGKNGATLGTCVLGDFTQITPTAAARNALAGLYAWKSCAETIDPLGSAPQGPLLAPLARVAGHRDGCNTACPGNAFYPLLPAVRLDILQRIGADCTCALEAPADLQVENGPQGPRLSWKPLPDTGLLYIIERRHPDEILFQLVGESTAAIWTDASALPGIAYRYRLRVQSPWCLSEPGQPVALPAEAEEWTIRPTLTEGLVLIQTNQPAQGLVRIQCYDALGRLVWAAAPWKPEGAWTYELDLGPFPAGLYILRLRFGGEERVVRVMKAG
jgi:hypothetical protein